MKVDITLYGCDDSTTFEVDANSIVVGFVSNGCF